MTTYTIEEIDQIMQEMKAELAELKNSRRRQVNWPPPEGWEEVVITWDSVFSTDKLHIPEIIEWLDKTPGGNTIYTVGKVKRDLLFVLRMHKMLPILN